MSTWCFNFKAQFVADVESGKKRQTIRALRKDGRLPKEGDIVKLYHGLRTKQTRLLNMGFVVRVRRVRFNLATGVFYFGCVRLQGVELNDFAAMDGFASFDAMLTWFREQHGRGVFVGFCTSWNPDLKLLKVVEVR